MDIKAKIEDIKMLVQNDRRVWAIGAFLGVVILVFLFVNKGPQRMQRYTGGAPEDEGGPSVLGSPSGDAYEDLVKTFQTRVEQIEISEKERREASLRIQRDLEAQIKTSENLFGTITEKIEGIVNRLNEVESKQELTPQGGSPSADGGPGMVPPAESEVRRVFFDDADIPAPPPDGPEEPIKVKVISPGDAVPVRLLTGVVAPTDGTPYPVVFKLDGPITGPDGAELDVGEARLIAAAEGSEIDGRAIFRLTNLSIRHPDGRRSVAEVDGWVVGEDGVRGMKGKVIDKLGQLIIATAIGSTAAALGDRAIRKEPAVTVNDSQNIDVNAGDINAAALSGLTDASNRLTEVLIDRYEKLVPVVEILSGRDAVAIFSSPVEIDTCEGDCGEDMRFAASLD